MASIVFFDPVLYSELKVLGIETIEVPAGEFECFKVVWSYPNMDKYHDTYYWFSTDDQRLLVLYEFSTTQWKLRSIESSD
jgi:hypothetical protein